MNKIVLGLVVAFISATGFAQKVEFTEYDLSNGLHVILHQENAAPTWQKDPAGPTEIPGTLLLPGAWEFQGETAGAQAQNWRI